MIIWGYCDRDVNEETGDFACPACGKRCEFTLIRTWKYLHVYFMPLLKQELLGEQVLCSECSGTFSITVLTADARSVSSFETNDIPDSTAENFGNVVALSDSAVDEIRRRHRVGGFDSNVAVRIEPQPGQPKEVLVTFDIPLADGRDWIGESQGIPVLVDRRAAAELNGQRVEYSNGVFILAVGCSR